jgi:hypothetical protein
MPIYARQLRSPFYAVEKDIQETLNYPVKKMDY